MIRRPIPLALAVLVTLGAAVLPAHAGPGDVNADSVYLIGEFVDPVCIFQHGMQGELQKQCALVPGRVDQGIYFLDIRARRIYSVIGQTHFEDPQAAFLSLLGDTVAVRAKVWERMGSRAIAIGAVYPALEQPRPAYTWWPWHFEWSVLLGCGILAALYLVAVLRYRTRWGGPPRLQRGRLIAFFCGLTTVVISLDGPLHDLSDLYLFSTHMVQHLFLAEAFPPLLLFGLPGWLVARLLRPLALGRAWGWLSRAPMGFALYTVVFSIWHVPTLYNLMMRDHSFHIVMHLMVMATAVLLWWPILGNEPGRPRLSEGAQVLYLFVVGIPMSIVAALITFAERPLYEWYALAPRFMGITAVDDQRMGGLIMWVPGALVYWGIMTAVFFRWSAREERTGGAVPQGAAGA